jgi:hypothetical protein
MLISPEREDSVQPCQTRFYEVLAACIRKRRSMPAGLDVVVFMRAVMSLNSFLNPCTTV